jgi:hypothetical protein
MNIKLFDDKLHAIISGALDRTEDRLVRNGECDPENADDFLTAKYIACCAGIIRGGNVYLPNDEWVGAEIFLTWLGDAQFKRLAPRTQSKCAMHLTNHTAIYFPNYHATLRLSLVHVLRSICGHEKVEKHGVVLLAAATLPALETIFAANFVVATRMANAYWFKMMCIISE